MELVVAASAVLILLAVSLPVIHTFNSCVNEWDSVGVRLLGFGVSWWQYTDKPAANAICISPPSGSWGPLLVFRW